ncbi:hypothetical protein GCM10011506_19560 [Marivirga lumbricoides]|uniref:Cation:proton antiporter n=1 Tax=Marivirga lumbricoides TaxID=1046115 RepID=A0ABQ1M4A6_9BACT|nr:hypothetical protein GCM10011506_19560 [Marivirga lumbricoides]
MKIFLTHIGITLVLTLAVKEYVKIDASGILQFAVILSFFLLLWLSSYVYSRSYFKKLFSAFGLFFYFLKELAVSNFRIIYYIITPGLKFRPAIIKLPLSLKSERGIVLLSNLITLTPGTLTLKISDDKNFLYYHCINVKGGQLDQERRKVKDGFEKRIMTILS